MAFELTKLCLRCHCEAYYETRVFFMKVKEVSNLNKLYDIPFTSDLYKKIYWKKDSAQFQVKI